MSEWIIKQRLKDTTDYSSKSLQEIYADVVALGYETDKGTTHSYIDSYAKLFEPYRGKPINFLEVGINFGYSLVLWKRYFHNANIYGIDNRNVLQVNEGANVLFYDANNPDITSKFYSDVEFDVIIDDASHEVEHQVIRFPIYFPKLKTGGLYVIEDVQCLDKEGQLLTNLNPTAEVIDLRKVKDRYDDVMITYKK